LDRTWSGYVDRVTVKSQTIEVDAETAALLESRAAERGVSVSQLVSELVPLVTDSGAIAELIGNSAAAVQGGSELGRRPARFFMATPVRRVPTGLRNSVWVSALLALGFASEFAHYLLDRAVYRFSIRRCSRRRAHS